MASILGKHSSRTLSSLNDSARINDDDLLYCVMAI